MRRALLAIGSGLSLGLIAAASWAQTVACHLTYGGESQVIEAVPASSPYVGAPTAIGSFFLFRIVFQKEPADLANVKLYTYADRDSGPVIIHQASYAYPLANAAVNGFSGLNFIYEPMRDGELQYWCEIK